MTEPKIINYLNHYSNLPKGCKLYFLSTDGNIFIAADNIVSKLDPTSEEFHDQMHVFINEGNHAHYLLGNPDTNEANPTNATVKAGVTEPHHHFVPHAHGVEHYVYSKGFSGYLLFNKERQEVQIIKLPPGSLIYISEMVPHSFYNRSDVPLITLIANGGLGINDEKYAITKETAEDLVKNENNPENRQQLQELISELSLVEDAYEVSQPQKDMSTKERVSKKLFTLAEYFSL